MRVHVNDQDRLFNSYWLPIQQLLGDGLTEFVRHYLMKEGKILKDADVYLELKDRLAGSSPLEAEIFLKDLHRHGQFYAKLIDTRREVDRDISKRLDRIRRLKVTVAYPLLLRVFDASESGRLSREQVLQTLDILESFVMRRSVCNVPTNQLRRMFPPVFDKATVMGRDFIEGLRENLGGRHCPDDETFVRHLTTEKLYSSGDKSMRLRIILERLEQSFGHREPADLAAATIEHVLPQTITDEWEAELGVGAREHWDRWLHSLGNLTLTGYNTELSNQPYAVKRASLESSHYELNRYFARVERWSAEAIRERAMTLADRALRIWPDVGRIASQSATRRGAAQRPVAVRFRGITHQVSSWKDGFVKLLELFESEQPGLLNRIAADRSLPSIISLDEEQFRAQTAQFGDVHISTHAGASTLQGWCRRVALLGNIVESDYEYSSPASVRFRDVVVQVGTWKECFLELLHSFESSQPGLLHRIAAERSMPSIISLDEDQFKAMKVQIGSVHINTHANAFTLQDWCRRVASLANISESDYGFVIPD